MAVSKHPSVKPSAPRKPPATSTTAGTVNKIPSHEGTRDGGGTYGFKHEVNVKPSHKSERAHDFHDHAGSQSEIE